MVPSYLYAFLLAGQYSTPLIYSEVKAVFTNTAPVDACRGAGRPEATYLVERLVDICAADMGLDPAEIRRRNFIPVDAFPIRLRSFSATTAETILRRWTRPWNWLTTAGFRHGLKKPSREANCAALVYLPTSKPAVLRPLRRWVSWVPESVWGKCAGAL